MCSVFVPVLLSHVCNTRRNCGNGEKKIYVEILTDLHVFSTSEYKNALCMRNRKKAFFLKL